MPSTGRPNARDRRRSAILALVQDRVVRNQNELRALLAAQGFAVNQATLSRDLRDMGLVKGPHGYAIPDAVPGSTANGDPAVGLVRALRDWLRSVDVAQNQVVVKTPVGGAQPLAIAIDHAELEDVVGTLGGDDTILVVCKDNAAARRVQRRLLRLRGESPA